MDSVTLTASLSVASSVFAVPHTRTYLALNGSLVFSVLTLTMYTCTYVCAHRHLAVYTKFSFFYCTSAPSPRFGQVQTNVCHYSRFLACWPVIFCPSDFFTNFLHFPFTFFGVSVVSMDVLICD